MERLPYIDEHAITVAATMPETWQAVLRIVCRDPRDPSTVPAGFVLHDLRPPERLALQGRHLFARYVWSFELDADGPHRTRVRSKTWAHFPGLHGRIYRALVIGTHAHRVVVRMTLRRIAAKARGGRLHLSDDAADYADVFETPVQCNDLRSAEEALRDALGTKPSPVSTAVLWIHRHVLGFRLGPVCSPDHIIGWSIVRSDADEVVLAANGALMHGELDLRRHDGRRAVLTTRLHYRRRFAGRAIWLMVGPLHRTIAPQLMKRAARVAV